MPIRQFIPSTVKFAVGFATFTTLAIDVPSEVYRHLWPTAAATITASNREWIVSTPSNGRGHPIARIEYTYLVGGVRYSCSNYNSSGPYGSWNPFVGEADVSAMVKAYPVGRRVSVHYKSSAPDFAVMRAHRTLIEWMCIIASNLALGVICGLGWSRFIHAKARGTAAA